MSNNPVYFEGYLVCTHDEGIIAKSRFKANHTHVFGPDSDYTTLAISAINFMRKTLDVNNFIVDDNIQIEVLQACGYLHDENSIWTIICSPNSAELCITKKDKLNSEIEGEETNLTFVKEIENAWIKEGNSISQGAYISDQSYNLSISGRMNLQGQKVDDNYVWPAREYPNYGSDIVDSNLSKSGTILSWTSLAPGGAPSEFSIRAPILGGISTVFVKLKDGPNGVFLMADDDSSSLEIGLTVDLVVRKIYAQEGSVRYGLKAIISKLQA